MKKKNKPGAWVGMMSFDKPLILKREKKTTKVISLIKKSTGNE